MTKYIKIGDWYFEVKGLRALRVDEYGEPYSAIANITITGDNAYIDGQMTREGEEFTKEDFHAFYNFCQMMELKTANWDRIKNGERKNRTVNIKPFVEASPVKLVQVK